MFPIAKEKSRIRPALQILTCGKCGRSFRAPYIFIFPDGSLRCVLCAGKTINLARTRIRLAAEGR